jgi:hypothetical protein
MRRLRRFLGKIWLFHTIKKTLEKENGSSFRTAISPGFAKADGVEVSAVRVVLHPPADATLRNPIGISQFWPNVRLVAFFLIAPVLFWITTTVSNSRP